MVFYGIHFYSWESAQPLASPFVIASNLLFLMARKFNLWSDPIECLFFSRYQPFTKWITIYMRKTFDIFTSAVEYFTFILFESFANMKSENKLGNLGEIICWGSQPLVVTGQQLITHGPLRKEYDFDSRDQTVVKID